MRFGRKAIARALERFSGAVTRKAGSTIAFAMACGIILVWGITGPLFGFSDTWQLVINTGTTVVTFLMVFLIQRSQNKDSRAIHAKLNELVAALSGASNRLIDVEDFSEEELEVLHKHFAKLARMAAAQGDLRTSHSVEEAEHRHFRKVEERGDENPSRTRAQPARSA